jgi:hypothetical protein
MMRPSTWTGEGTASSGQKLTGMISFSFRRKYRT